MTNLYGVYTKEQSSHSSIFNLFLWNRVVGVAAPAESHTHLCSPSHLLQLIKQDLKVFPCQLRSWVFLWVCSQQDMPGTLLQRGIQEASKADSRAPQLIPLKAEEQWIYSKDLEGDQGLCLIPEGAQRHPIEETHFSHLYLRFRFFSQFSWSSWPQVRVGV